MGQNVSGAGNQGPTIAELQSKIKELRKDGVTAAERQEILSLTEQISKALSGTTVKGDMVGLTISKDGEHVEDTDGNIATREQVEAQRYYTSKDNVRAEFCNTTMTKAEFQALKREVEVKKEEVEELRKAYNKVPSGLAHEAEKTAALTRYTLAADQLLKLESKYNAEEVLQRGAHKNKGVGGIVDAAKNNVENMENVLNVEKVYTNKDEMELFLEENPSMKGKVKFLNKGGQEALSNMIADANVVLSRAQTAHEEGRITDEQYEQIKAKYELRTSAHLYNSDGTINVRAVQNALVDISGSDQNFNLDEIGVTADDLLVKKKHVKSLAKTFGFGTEGEGKQRWTAFAKAALPALVGNLVMNGIFGRQSSSAHAKESANQEYWYADSSTTERVQTVIDGYNSDGSAFREIFTEVTTNPNWEKGAASVTAEAFAKATAQIPWLGTLAGPVAAGVFAFFMCHPETESAFGDATIEKALQDLNVVEGDENKLIVAQIQNMEITGNTVMDNRIKAAVLKQSRGETTQKINTEELLAAYQSLKDTKAKIQEIITQGVPTTETTSNTETTTTTPTDLTTPDIDEPTPPGPVTQEECHNTETMDLYTKVPIIKYGGPWHYTQLYVNEDGSELSAADRKALTKLLKDKNGEYGLRDVYENGRRTGRQLTTEITLPSGKVVKLADDAAARAAKISGNPGGTDIKYNTERNGSRMRAVDCKTGQPLTGWMTPSEFQQWEADRAK